MSNDYRFDVGESFSPLPTEELYMFEMLYTDDGEPFAIGHDRDETLLLFENTGARWTVRYTVPHNKLTIATEYLWQETLSNTEFSASEIEMARATYRDFMEERARSYRFEASSENCILSVSDGRCNLEIAEESDTQVYPRTLLQTALDETASESPKTDRLVVALRDAGDTHRLCEGRLPNLSDVMME